MKRGIKSLILLGVLVALLGSYGLVNHMTRQAEVSEEAGTFALSERGEEELTGISWQSDAQYHFTKDENGWANADDAAFPTDQEALSQLADKLTTLEATRKLTDVENLADYGFGEDSFTVTAEWSDGSADTYILGDATPFADGYYVRLDSEDGVIYTMSSSLSAMFAETAVDLAQLEEIGSVETATSLQIGDALQLDCYAESISIDPDQHWYGADGEPMDDEAVESVIADIQALEWQELQAVSATEDELAEYQLDDANAVVISVAGNDGDGIGLYIGTANADGAYYARLPGSGMVYTLDGEAVEAILASSEDVLWNNEIFPLDWADVQQFACTLNGVEMIFEPAEEAGEESEEAEDDPAKTVWSQICALYATNRSEAEPAGEALLQISVTSADGGSMDCSIYGYDVDSYLAVTSEGRSLLVSADDVDKLIRTLKQ